MKTASIIVAVLIAYFGTQAAFESVMRKLNSNQEIKGYTLQRETFNAGCVPEANTAGFGEDASRQYCNCVYDAGLNAYGMQGWTEQLRLLGETNVITPDVNEFVNDCSRMVLESESV